MTTQYDLPYSIRQVTLAYHLNVHPNDISEDRANTFSVSSYGDYHGIEPDSIVERVESLRESLEKIGMNFATRKQLLAWADMLSYTTLGYESWAWWSAKGVLTTNKFLKMYPNTQLVMTIERNAYKYLSSLIDDETELATLHYLICRPFNSELNRNNRDHYYYFAVRDAFDGKEIDDTRYEFDSNSDEYRVLTDDEFDDEFQEYVDNYIDEFVFSQIPESYRRYFDEKLFFEDAKSDGRSEWMGLTDEEIHLKQDGLLDFIKRLLIEEGNHPYGVERIRDIDSIGFDEHVSDNWLYIYER